MVSHNPPRTDTLVQSLLMILWALGASRSEIDSRNLQRTGDEVVGEAKR